MNKIHFDLLESWLQKDNGILHNAEILTWVHNKNETTFVNVKKTELKPDGFWYYNKKKGVIENKNESFFKIVGMQSERNGIAVEQPIILQKEIGFLGIIMKRINGVLHCLMQAKIEPGNVNKIQISPTIQATKSNFTQKHGGMKPAYLDYFLKSKPSQIVVDQLQSEQGLCFYKKRNRNIILIVDEDVPILSNYRWMTIGQVKNLMKYDNLVNMDTRTVLSCIPISCFLLTDDEKDTFRNKATNPALINSMFPDQKDFFYPPLYNCINNEKMFHCANKKLTPLHELSTWEMHPDAIICKKKAPFKVVYCDISIEGREVTNWVQPLFEANKVWCLGLICFERNSELLFIVKVTPEIGTFDDVELGPTIQTQEQDSLTEMDRYFWKTYNNNPDSILHDVNLSEEGGRFYHEVNKNIVLKVSELDIPPLTNGFFAFNYYNLNQLTQTNNCLNIQLRNLLSLLEV